MDIRSTTPAANHKPVRIAAHAWDSGQTDVSGTMYLELTHRVAAHPTLAAAREAARVASEGAAPAVAVLQAADGTYELYSVAEHCIAESFDSWSQTWSESTVWLRPYDQVASERLARYGGPLASFRLLDPRVVEVADEGSRTSIVVGDRFS